MSHNWVFTVILSLFSHFLSSQCYPDRHNTSYQNGWVSCEMSDNPNPLRNKGHWILFDLGFNYRLTDSWFWNYNHPDFLDLGINKVMIDYSQDGTDWNEVGAFEFQKASGISRYEGQKGPDFGNIETRYLLFSVLENFGDLQCTGFAEIRINLGSVSTAAEEIQPLKSPINVYPNPFSDIIHIEIKDDMKKISYLEIKDILGRTVYVKSVLDGDRIAIDAGHLSAGQYFLRVSEGTHVYSNKLIHISEH